MNSKTAKVAAAAGVGALLAYGAYRFFSSAAAPVKDSSATAAAAATPAAAPAYSGPQRTFVMLKPEAGQRGLVGRTIAKIEARGYKIADMKMVKPSKELVTAHYAHVADKPFFPSMLAAFTASPVVVLVVIGAGSVANVRRLLGSATNPAEADPGSARFDWSVAIGRNVVHTSESPEDAEKEIALWFSSGLMAPWEHHQKAWVSE